MLTLRPKNILQVTFSPSKKPKLNYGKLPKDFFQRSHSLKIRRSYEFKRPESPFKNTAVFGRKRPTPIQTERKVVTAFGNQQNVEEDEMLVRNMISSSNNIRSYRRNSLIKNEQSKMQDKQFHLFTPQLPPLKSRKVFTL